MRVDWSSRPSEIDAVISGRSELARRFIESIHAFPDVQHMSVDLHRAAEEGGSPSVVFDVWISGTEAHVFSVFNRLSDILEGLESELNVPVGDSVIVPHAAG